MTFFKNSLLSIALLGLVTACGSGDAPTTSDAEKTVEKRDVATDSSSSTTSPAPAPATPSEPDVQFASLPEPYASADYNRGKRTFKLCQTCHTLNEGGQNLVGPNLHGIFGQQAASVDGFTYSKALAGSDIVWTPEILGEWLESPRNFLPGNKMSFSGVRKPSDRTAVIAYIMAETGYTAE